MDSNYLRCIFYKDSYTREIFEGVFPKDQVMKEHFEKGIYMCVVNEQDSQFPGSHWLMVYENKKRPTLQTLLEDILPTMNSSSRDLFTKYLEDYNVQTRNYVELILCFLDAD